MKLTCEGCQAKYSIADDKVAGRTFKIRCKRCGAALVVRGEAVVAASAPRVEGEWYVLAGERQDGPFEIAELREKLASGAIDRDTYVWKDGLSDWQPLGAIGELAQLAPPEREADLFDSASEPSPFAPSAPEPSSASLTGSRNESSVLFSLSNLSALSTSAPEAPMAASPSVSARGAAKGDGSGLIDIRALAAATQPREKPASAPSADDLLSLGSAPSLSSPLGPPVIVPPAPARGNRSTLFALIGAAGAIALAAAVVIVVLVTNGQTAARADAPPAERIQPPSVSVAPIETRSIETRTVETRTVEPAPIAANDATAEPTEVAITPPPPRETERAPRRSPRRTEEEAAPEVTRAPRPEPSPPRNIEQMIDDAIDPTSTPATRERPAERLPGTPSRADVTGAMSRVAGPVRACGNGARGMVPVQVVFSGDTGRVSSAEVNGTSIAPEVRSCIARAVRDASVPRFSQSTFRVVYPFAL